MAASGRVGGGGGFEFASGFLLDGEARFGFDEGDALGERSC